MWYFGGWNLSVWRRTKLFFRVEVIIKLQFLSSVLLFKISL